MMRINDPRPLDIERIYLMSPAIVESWLTILKRCVDFHGDLVSMPVCRSERDTQVVLGLSAVRRPDCGAVHDAQPRGWASCLMADGVRDAGAFRSVAAG